MRIEIKNLTKTYGEVRALSDFSVTFENGIYGILGPNGAGKSTMIGLLTDTVSREAGQILCDGTDILEMGSKFRSTVGYMPQQQSMYDNYSAISFLKYMASVKGIPSKKAATEIEQLLKTVNLWEERYRRVGGFSGGMRQRVLLAQALLGSPKLLILDEPTAGLDPNERIRIRNYISELSGDRIILFATHVVSDIECISDKIMMLKNGKMIIFSPTASVIESMEGKVAAVECGEEDIDGYRKRYKIGNINRTSTGFSVRIVGDRLPPEAVNIGKNVNLEDAYLYYLA
ncbi:MAG: ATP-binding cassette domain-containing protein [Butyrivibrio sp.]|nr:ATP-binding cassette domain-containing protein [Butyrivibrio sp.]